MADLKEFQRKMEKTLDVLASDFAAVRAGRANAQVLDRITVEYYGQPSPINQVGTVSSPTPARSSSSRGTGRCSRRSKRPSRPRISASTRRMTAASSASSSRS